MRPFLVAAVGWLAVVHLAPLSSAHAQCDDESKKRANSLYQQGTTQYNLGRWEQSIDLFQRSYEECPASALLFNIAQAYRQWGNCDRALFFYRRFLAVNPDATNRREVEGFIADLEETCKKTRESSERPPLETVKPGGPDEGRTGTKTTGGTDVALRSDDDDDDDEFEQPPRITATAPRPSAVASTAEVGAAFIGLGDIDVPAQFSLRLGIGYPIDLGEVGIEVGALFGYTPVPWDNQTVAPAEAGTAGLFSLLANAAAIYPVIDKLAVRGEVGLGLLMFTGLDNPAAGGIFLEEGKMATGALTMFHLRLGLGAEYSITPNLVLSAHPVVFSFSPAKGGLDESISSIMRFELMAGVGYKM